VRDKAILLRRRPKLADDGTRFGPGQPIMTPSIYKAEIIAQHRQMEFVGLVASRCSIGVPLIVGECGFTSTR